MVVQYKFLYVLSSLELKKKHASFNRSSANILVISRFDFDVLIGFKDIKISKIIKRNTLISNTEEIAIKQYSRATDYVCGGG